MLAEARGERRDDAAEWRARGRAGSRSRSGRALDASACPRRMRAPRGLAKAREGDAPLALTHLALAGAGRLDRTA